MKLLQRIEIWGNQHHPKWLDAVRICLGIFLFYMGIVFIQNRDALITVINYNPSLAVLSIWLGHYIVFAHLAGGLLIALGSLTRLSVLVNIPVMLGAIFFVHSPTELFLVYRLPGLPFVILLLLVFFLVEGSGPLSVDAYMRRHPA